MYREGICGMKVSKRKLYWSPSCTTGTKSVMETNCKRKDLSLFTVSQSFHPTQQEGHSRADKIIKVSVEEDDHSGPESRKSIYNRNQRLAITSIGSFTVTHTDHGGPTFSRFHNLPSQHPQIMNIHSKHKPLGRHFRVILNTRPEDFPSQYQKKKKVRRTSQRLFFF